MPGVRILLGAPCYIWWMWPSWLGRQIVALEVVGSNPIIHPIDFKLKQHDPLAQAVEHLTFNQGVRRSSRRWVTSYAGVAELADALDLGSSVFDVGVQVLSPAPNKNWREPIFFILCFGGKYEVESIISNSTIFIVIVYI